MAERILRDSDGCLPRACLYCPARVFAGSEDYCDPSRLNDRNIILKVARYRPDACPRNIKVDSRSEPPEILLRKMLGR